MYLDTIPLLSQDYKTHQFILKIYLIQVLLHIQFVYVF